MRQHEGRPEVSPWLRGWDEDEEAHTNVAWRTYLPCEVQAADVTTSPTMVSAFFRHAPLHGAEKLEAVSSRVMDWLLKRAARIGKRRPDGDLAVRGNEIVAILIDRNGDHVESASLSQLQWLAAPAKSMGTGVQRQRDRRKRDWTERVGASMRPPEFTGGNPAGVRTHGYARLASMRPPEFTGGNRCSWCGTDSRSWSFNEAAGIHRRKPSTRRTTRPPGTCFNEAAGIHRRKLPAGLTVFRHWKSFNEAAGIHRRKQVATFSAWLITLRASMRPPEFTGGNHPARGIRRHGRAASMRPPEFTGGNNPDNIHKLKGITPASMRPPEFTGGNLWNYV